MKQSILHHQKKCLKRILIFAVILFLGSSFYSFRSYASSIVGIEDQLDGMSGDAKYAGSEYRDNYRLDTEHLGLTEAGSKMMAEFSNGIWLFIYWIAFLGIALFAGRIAFRNKLVARGCGLLFVIVGYVVDRRAGRAMELHALGIEHVFFQLG